MTKTYRLPTGETTRNQTLYVKSWNLLGETLASAIGQFLYAYDPGVCFSGRYQSTNVPCIVALPFYKALVGHELSVDIEAIRKVLEK